MKAKIYDSGSIKTVLVQDDNGDKFITGLEELLDMLDGDLEWEIETTNESLKSKLYKYAGLMREVGKIRREIESYNTSKVFPVNDFLKDVELQHDKKVIDNYLLGKDLQLEPIPAYSKLPIQGSIKFPASLSQSGSDTIGVQPAPRDYTYDGMRVEIDGITGTVEYTDVHDGLSLRFRGEEAGFLELTPDGIKMPRFEIDDIRMWVYMRELQEGTWDVFDSKIGLGAQADTPGKAIKLYLEKLKDNKFVGRGYLNHVGITEYTRKIGEFNKCKKIVNIEVVLKYNDLLKPEERDANLSVNWMTLYGMRGNVRRSEEGVYRLVFKDEDYHLVMLPTLHETFVPLARIEHKDMMVMVVNIYSPDGYKWNARVDDTPFKNEGATTPEEALTGLFEYVKDHKIPLEDLNKLGIYSNATTIGSYGKYTMINVQVAVRFEDIAVQGGDEKSSTTLDILYVTFDVKDSKGNDVTHFMLPSLTGNNHYIVESEYSRDEIINQALKGGYLTRKDMEERGWKGDTPPEFSDEDIDKMVGPFNWISFNIKVPKEKIIDDWEGEAEKEQEEGPTLDVLFVFFNVKDISGELVPHFMVPSLTTDNAYIMEEGHDDPVSLVKKALGEYKLSEGDMEYLGWEGDTPPNLTRDDINEMVKIDDCWVSVTRKVPRKLIARD